MKKKITFEEAIVRLEEIVTLLENSDTPIEKSLEYYEEGVKLSAFCNEILEKAHLKITDLSSIEEKSIEK